MRFDDRDSSSQGGLARFPGAIAVPVESIGAGPPTIVMESTDDQPWAVELSYHDVTGPLLTVRTVRSAAGLDPRGLPVEDLASAIVNFGLRAAASIPSSRVGTDAAEAWLTARLQQNVSSRGDVARTPRSHVHIPIDGAQVIGERVDVAGCAAVQLSWRDQVVLCSGVPSVINGLRLRSAAPEDLVTS